MKELIDRLDEPQFRPLVNNEEEELGQRLLDARKRGDDAEATSVRDEIINRHLRLVVHIAKGYPVLDRDEAFAVGCLALTQAAERWQPDRGHIYPWAERWITTALTRAADASRTIRLPQQVAYKAGLAAKKIAEREVELGRALTPDEIAEIDDGQGFASHPTVVASLDAGSLSDDSSGLVTIQEVLPDPTQDPHLDAERTLVREQVARAIQELSPLEQEVVMARFGIADDHRRTLAELGAAHGVSGEAMRRVEAAALAKLRHPAALECLWGAV